MEKLRINRSRFSELAWEIILDSAAVHAHSTRDELFSKSLALDDLRANADYDTGSISTGAIWALFSACTFFRPKTIAEVGTFIGKSTFAMACGLDLARKDDTSIWTCDFSNDITLNFGTRTEVHQFKRQSSTDMFKAMAIQGARCDLLLLDGRLQEDDLPLLSGILHQESIILLDDFEGIEKGVANASRLMGSLNESHFLAYPPSRALMQRHGLQEACTVGMIVPRGLVINTNQ